MGGADELDVAFRVHAAGWRVGAAYGKMWAGEAGIADRLARNL